MKIVKPSAKMVNCTLSPLVAIEYAARHSTRTTDKTEGREDFVASLIKRGHMTPFRFATATFSVVADRGVIDELRTHQHADFVVESTRYCGYDRERFGGELEFIEPPFYKYQWQKACEAAEYAYLTMRSAGVSPQLCRSVLPLSIASSACIHANMQEWLHVCNVRTAKDAHPQCREVVMMILEQLAEYLPVVFGEPYKERKEESEGGK